MIQREDNPEYVNQFLDYTATILNKSPNTIKEYNYDIAMFLRFIKIHFKMTNETELDNIKFNDIGIDTIKKISLSDIHAFDKYIP